MNPQIKVFFYFKVDEVDRISNNASLQPKSDEIGK